MKRSMLGPVVPLILALCSAIPGRGATYLVQNTNPSGPNSLAQAVIDANGNPGSDTIAFQIPGAGPHVIMPNSGFTLTGTVFFEPTTQTGWVGNTAGTGWSGTQNLVIDGTNAGGGENGFLFDTGSDGSTLYGLTITNWPGEGVQIESNSVVVYGCFIGVGADGSTAAGNGGVGIMVNAVSTFEIGGANAWQRNVISGNGGAAIEVNEVTTTLGNAVIANNYLGTTATGVSGTSLGNAAGIVTDTTTNLVIGGSGYPGNVIAGNLGHGINLTFGDLGTNIALNFIGQNADGSLNSNTGHGINVGSTEDAVIGPNNVIVGNLSGIRLSYATNINIVGNQIGTDQFGNIGAGISGINSGTIIIGNGSTPFASGGGNQISNNGDSGILLDANEGPTDLNVIVNNRIGTTFDGLGRRGNAGFGIDLINGGNNTIGDFGGFSSNLVSNNTNGGIHIYGDDDPADQNRITNNTIGLNAAGLPFDAPPSQAFGIRIDATGGSGSAAGNVIESNVIGTNAGHGVHVTTALATSTSIGSNTIGLAADGQSPAANGGNGIYINNQAAANTIGAGNYISGNNLSGIRLEDSADNVIAGNVVGLAGTGAALGNAQNDTLGIHAGVTLYNSLRNTIGSATAGAGNTISGNFGGGLWLDGAGSYDNLVINNFIGTNTAGLEPSAGRPHGNGGPGIYLNTPTSSNTIGGVGLGNVIAANNGPGILVDKGNFHHIYGNRIGVDKNGTDPSGSGFTGNNGDGIAISGGPAGPSYLQIGGGDSGEGNTISRNAGNGIRIQDHQPTTLSHLVRGNFIGTDSTGTVALGNQGFGVELVDSHNLTLGGTAPSDSNVISGNTNGGIRIENLGDTAGPAGNHEIYSNFIGVDVDGEIKLGNNGPGIQIDDSNSNTIGANPAPNQIGGNSFGIRMTNSNSNRIEGNLIGSDSDRVTPLGNSLAGIGIFGNSGGNAILHNLLADNALGLEISGPAAHVGNNTISDNEIGGNFGNQTGIQISNVGSNTIGGSGGNQIFGNTGPGIRLIGSNNNALGDNEIGVSNDGGEVNGNSGYGLELTSGSSGNTIGAGPDNWFGDNGTGGVLISGGSNNNQISGNTIGGDFPGEPGPAIGNQGPGIDVNGATGTQILSNEIRHNSGDGVRLAAGTGNRLVQNNLALNGGLGINLVAAGDGSDGVTPNDASDNDTGPNNLQNAPVLLQAYQSGSNTVIEYAFDSPPGQTTYGLTVDFYASQTPDPSGFGEGESYRGFQQHASPPSGLQTFSSPASTSVGDVITGTLTDSNGNTSEFSNAVAVTATAGNQLVVINTQDTGFGSLREVAARANAGGGNATIEFHIPASFATGNDFIIPLQSPVIITQPGIVIDGASQRVFSGNPAQQIVIDGAALTSGQSSLVYNAVGTVRNLTIANSGGAGLQIGSSATGMLVQTSVFRANDIGLDDQATQTTLGGPGAGNSFSGNTTGLVLRGNQALVQGNFFGPITSDPNGLGIKVEAANSTLGGTNPNEGNDILGNSTGGILITGSTAANNLLVGNRIGAPASGTGGSGNGGAGVRIESNAHDNTIGGDAGTGAANLIGRNSGSGIELAGAGTDNLIRGNQIGWREVDDTSFPNGVGVQINGTNETTVGGPNVADRNVITGNSGRGILGTGASDGLIQNNLIGFYDAGTSTNGGAGILLEAGSARNSVLNNAIGGNATAGVHISDSGSDDNVIRGNQIGHNGSTANPNAGPGIRVDDGALRTVIGGTGANQGNSIAGNQGDGVRIIGPSSGTILIQNRIGESTTLGLSGNTGNGVSLDNSASNTIGGLDTITGPLGAGNLLVGNQGEGLHIAGTGSANNLVQGNRIGILDDGTTAAGNGFSGVFLDNAQNNTIGGTADGAENLIGDNALEGIFIAGPAASGNQIQGNLIGTDATGNQARGNASCGICIAGAGANTIGGPTAAHGNLLSGNTRAGVDISQGAGNLLQNNRIGTNLAGNTPVPNEYGVLLGNGTVDTTLGGHPTGGNLISGNLDHGIGVGFAGSGSQTNSVAVERTRIVGNTVGMSFNGSGSMTNGGYQAFTGADSLDTVLGDDSGGENLFGPGGVGVDGDGTQAEIRANRFTGTGLAIDLQVGGATGPTPNDPNDADVGPNGGLNFPVIQNAHVAGGGSQLVIQGFSGAGTTIRVFLAPPQTGFGPGLTYLGTFVEGGPDDGASGSGSYSGTIQGVNQGSDTTNTFSFTVPIPSGVSIGSRLTATATLNGATSEFGGNALVTAEPLTPQLAFVQQPTSAEAGATITPPITVELLGPDGNRDTSSSASVALTANHPGNAQPIGTATKPAVNGLATFDDLQFDVPGSGVTLTATATGFSPATSDPFNITARPAVGLRFVQQPSDAVVQTSIAPPITVELIDNQGQRVTGGSASVGIALANNPTSATLSGSTTQSTADGVATFDDLKVDLAGTGYTLQVSATNLTGATSNPFNIVSTTTDPAQSSFSADKTQAIANGIELVSFTITLRDGQSNPVPNVPAGSIQLSSPGQQVTITQPSQPTDATGRTTATATSTKAQSTTFSATFGGQPIGQPLGVQFVPGPVNADRSTFTVNPSTALANGSSLVTLTITALDANSNPIPNLAPSSISIVSDGSNVTINPPTQPTDANGQTTATATSTQVQTAAFTATVGGTLIAQRPSAQFLAGDVSPNQSTFTASPTTVVANGSDAFSLALTILDAQGHPKVGVAPSEFSFTSSGVDLTINGPTQPTDANGRTVASAVSLNVGVAIVTATVSGVPLQQQPRLEFVPGPVSGARSSFTANPSATVADGSSSIALTLIARDAQDHPIPNIPADQIQLSATGPLVGNGLTLTGPSQPTDSAGQGLGSAVSLNVGIAVVTATVQGVVVEQKPQVQFDPGPLSAANSSLVASPATALADGSSPITVRLTARDAQNHPIPNIAVNEIQFSATSNLGGDGLTLNGPTGPTNADGQTTMTATATRPQTVDFGVSVRGESFTAAGSFTPRLVDPANSTVSITPSKIAADGTEQAVIQVGLRDASNQPVEGSPAAARSLATQPGSGVTLVNPGQVTGQDGIYRLTVTAQTPGSYQLTPSVGDVALSPVSLQALTFFDLSLPAGLSFASLPLTPDADSFATLLQTSGLVAVRFDGPTQQYVRLTTPLPSLPAGTGIWFRLTQPLVFRLQGELTPLAPYALPLARGWNAAGNPFDQVLNWNLSAIRVLVNGSQVGTLNDQSLWTTTVRPYGWIYAPELAAYRLVFDPSRPGFGQALGGVPRQSGLWLEALAENVSLVLPTPTAGARSRATRQVTARDWTVDLVARLGDSVDSETMFGVSSDLSRALPVTSPPPAGEPGLIEMSILDADQTRLAGLVRTSGAGSETWEAEVVTRAAGEVLLTWPSLLRQVPRGLVVELTDLETGQSTLLNTRAAYRYQSPGDDARRFRLTTRFGNIDRATITALSATPSRGGGTALTMTLTGPAQVVVTVRGLGGRLVKQFGEDAAGPGTITLTWDGTDQEGRQVPRGSYQVEATAQSTNGALNRVVRTVLVP